MKRACWIIHFSLEAYQPEGYNLRAMQIKDLGEFGVIDLLNKMVVRERKGPDNGAPFAFRLLVDTGDDTAAWRAGQAAELFTTDTVVEGVHFTRATTPWRDLGWKSIASNVSDIAAMGGLPLYALVTLGLPPDTEVADIQELYQGMLEIGNKYGVAIIGGDMVRSPVVFITVSLTGVHSGQPLLRSTAHPGDQVAVTGYLGVSGGGLKLLLEDGQVSPQADDCLFQGHRRPQPAVAEGRILVEFGVKTAMDVSDGLVDDLSKLCLASGVAARLFTGQIPAHPRLKEAFPDQYLDLALNGGEDYVLLFTAAKELMAEVMPRLPTGAAVVGEITAGIPGQVVVVDSSGAETVAGRGGWDHFR
jgi:thiamine-monophosphate kinase